jgi:hypothetical protein
MIMFAQAGNDTFYTAAYSRLLAVQRKVRLPGLGTGEAILAPTGQSIHRRV